MPKLRPRPGRFRWMLALVAGFTLGRYLPWGAPRAASPAGIERLAGCEPRRKSSGDADLARVAGDGPREPADAPPEAVAAGPALVRTGPSAVNTGPAPAVVPEPAPRREAPEEAGWLPTHEIARRALEWAAAIRGDGVYGAGVVVDRRGYVLTAWHVVEEMSRIRVSFVDTGEYPAEIVEHDAELDLALLKVDVERPSAAPLASFLTARIGDEVLTVGSPRKMDFTVARGIVSFVGRRMRGQYYLQTDLPTNGGNSGGPVVNRRGEVVAVMSFNLRGTQGLSFATPIDVAFERFGAILGRDRLDIGRYREWRQARADRAPPGG